MYLLDTNENVNPSPAGNEEVTRSERTDAGREHERTDSQTLRHRK